jgi:Saxitoxin biosynthesis operon protein SxtJ
MSVAPPDPQAVKPKQLRSFGLLVGAIFLFLGLHLKLRLALVPLYHADGFREWAFGLGGVLVVLGAVAPAALRFPYKGWMALGAALGWVNTRIWLGLVFFLLFTPLAILRRALGKDGLHRRFDKDAGSYRTVRDPSRATGDLTHPF